MYPQVASSSTWVVCTFFSNLCFSHEIITLPHFIELLCIYISFLHKTGRSSRSGIFIPLPDRRRCQLQIWFLGVASSALGWEELYKSFSSFIGIQEKQMANIVTDGSIQIYLQIHVYTQIIYLHIFAQSTKEAEKKQPSINGHTQMLISNIMKDGNGLSKGSQGSLEE